VPEIALDAEMTEHLGYDKHDPVGRVSGSNSRNGTRPKTVFTAIGPVEIEVPATTPCAPAHAAQHNRSDRCCLLTRRETCGILGRFDESHTVINYDLDYCLRAWSKDLVNVFTPGTRITSRICQSRRAHGGVLFERLEGQWRTVLRAAIHILNIALTRLRRPHSAARADS
jgi:GT2 family glycosyltransferase